MRNYDDARIEEGDEMLLGSLTAVIEKVSPEFLLRGPIHASYRLCEGCVCCGRHTAYCCTSGPMGGGSSISEDYIHVCRSCSYYARDDSVWYGYDGSEWADNTCPICRHQYGCLPCPKDEMRVPADRAIPKLTRVRVPIRAETLQGQPDGDYSRTVPLDRELQCIDRAPVGDPHRSYFDGGHSYGRGFEAVVVGGHDVLWIAERHEWIAVYVELISHHFEGTLQGAEDVLEVRGPLGLTEAWGEAILRAYGVSHPSAADAIKTSPAALCGGTLTHKELQ